MRAEEARPRRYASRPNNPMMPTPAHVPITTPAIAPPDKDDPPVDGADDSVAVGAEVSVSPVLVLESVEVSVTVVSDPVPEASSVSVGSGSLVVVVLGLEKSFPSPSMVLTL